MSRDDIGVPRPARLHRADVGFLTLFMLLPRHWDWLATQPGGSSVALRKLVEQARLANQDKDQRHRLSAMAGNESGFEEAPRALFAGRLERFDEIIAPWPTDVRDHARKLAHTATHTEPAA